MDDEQLEAARIDGAGWWSQLRYVILPELRGTIEFYVVIASITMLAWVFAYVCTITAGRPGDVHDGARALHLQQGPAELAARAWRRRSRSCCSA